MELLEEAKGRLGTPASLLHVPQKWPSVSEVRSTFYLIIYIVERYVKDDFPGCSFSKNCAHFHSGGEPYPSSFAWKSAGVITSCDIAPALPQR